MWLTPFDVSPGAEHGYDVADHCPVDPKLGTFADLDALLADAHALGLRVLLDLVPNHTAIEHRRFREHPDWSLWRDGRGAGPPKERQSTFGGLAWTRPARGPLVPPSLRSRPARPRLVESGGRASLRRDPALLARPRRRRLPHRRRARPVEDPTFADQPDLDPAEPNPAPFADQGTTYFDRPEVHGVYRRRHRLTAAYEGERALVGEVVLYDQERVARYVRRNELELACDFARRARARRGSKSRVPGRDELELACDFALLRERGDAGRLRATIDRTRAALAPVGASAAWVLENHHVPRLPTRPDGAAPSASAGPERPRSSCWRCRERRSSTGARSSGSRRSTSPTASPGRSSSGVVARARGVTAVASPCRGRARRPATASPPAEVAADAGRRGERSVEAEKDDPGATLARARRSPAVPEVRAQGATARPGTLSFARGEVVCLLNVNADPALLPPGELLVAGEPIADRLPAAPPPGSGASSGEGKQRAVGAIGAATRSKRSRRGRASATTASAPA